VEQARAAVEQAALELSYTRIYAPESGRVTRKVAEEGAYVQVGQALMVIVPSQVWVVANFKETQLTSMRPGQPVEITVDAYPDKVFIAHVDSIQAGTGARFSLLPPENATGNYVKVVQRIPVKIVFDEPPDPNHLLGPGMSAVPVVKIK
jgi:membrane fusion protein (multidrug efflux system)